jgi:flavorubredoxin
MKPLEIKPDVYWIGALHPDLRLFDLIMHTKNGTTYNSYLIKDEKSVIIDTVKEKFSSAYLERIVELVDPKHIDYIVVQHNEMDHSGSLAALLDLAPQAEILCTKTAVKYVQNIINREARITAVDANTVLALGQKTLRFIPAPFLHWPDTMMSYIPEAEILFSCDVFASHFCDSRMFADLITRNFWPDYEYYFKTIMRPFKKNVRNALKKVNELPMGVLAPSHGPIVREDTGKFVQAYEQWSAPARENTPKYILIYYASAYGNTERMAQQIARGMEEAGAHAELFDVVNIKAEDELDKMESADAILFGSPTINNDAAKPIWDLLSSLVTLDVKGKVAGSFGSMGWSGEAVGLIDQRLQGLKFKVPVPGLSAVLVPNTDELNSCVEFGKSIVQAL